MARLLLDEQIPRLPAPLLVGHQVRTLSQMRWNGLRNGRLLNRAEDEFDVLITMDRSLRFQQSLEGRRLAVVLLRARSTRIQDLEPVVTQALEGLQAIEPGQFAVVERRQPEPG